MRRERSDPILVAHLLPSCAVAVAVAAVVLATGCTRPLAVQHEYFRPGSGVAALASVKATHTVSHHRALQAAQRACGSPDLPEAAVPGPEMGAEAATLALAETCAKTVAKTGSVAAHGATANAFRRWTEDQVRELPATSETASSAGGGS